MATIIDELLELTVCRKGHGEAPLAIDFSLCCCQSSSSSSIVRPR